MNIDKFVSKLGADRTRIIKTKNVGESGPKDANDALKAGFDLNTFVEKAES